MNAFTLPPPLPPVIQTAKPRLRRNVLPLFIALSAAAAALCFFVFVVLAKAGYFPDPVQITDSTMGVWPASQGYEYISVTNGSDHGVKDFNICWEFIAPSGTVVDRRWMTVYEYVGPHKAARLEVIYPVSPYASCSQVKLEGYTDMP